MKGTVASAKKISSNTQLKNCVLKIYGGVNGEGKWNCDYNSREATKTTKNNGNELMTTTTEETLLWTVSLNEWNVWMDNWNE